MSELTIDVKTMRLGVQNWMEVLKGRGGIGDGSHKDACMFLMHRLFLGSAGDQEVLTLLTKFAKGIPVIIEERGKSCSS
jgi:hypothetical protein